MHEPNRAGDTGTPEVSIVIPTHNRAHMLGHTLEALARQDFDLARVEVIVVDDGSTDDTQAYLVSRDWGLRLLVLHQEQSGVSAARNHGASVAAGEMLIFIDDDIAAAPGFIAAHFREHDGVGSRVVVGRLAPSDLPGAKAPGWWRWLEWQFEKQYDEILRGERPMDGLMLYSGNFSISRKLFWQVGGFDEALPVQEDSDLGLRLQEAGAEFRLCLDAIGHHSGYHGYKAWRRSAYRAGTWDSEQMLKWRKYHALGERVRDFRGRHPMLRRTATMLLGRRRGFEWAIGCMRATAVAAAAFHLWKVERYAYAGIYDLTYWRGLCDGIGGFSLLRRYLEAEELLEAAA